MPKGMLTDRDHLNLEAFVGFVLDAFRDGRLPQDKAATALVELFTAVDHRDEGTVRNQIEQGRKFIAEIGDDG